MISRLKRLVFINSLLFLMLSSLAIAYSSFTLKDYEGYLNNLTSELNPKQAEARISFDTLAIVSVALDKTQGWTKATGAQSRRLLEKDAEASARLMALHALLAGDVKPLLAVLRCMRTEPAYSRGEGGDRHVARAGVSGWRPMCWPRWRAS